MTHGSSKVTRYKGQGASARMTAMTYLSDKECARVNDIQEVPEATIEGCLEKGMGEESRSAAAENPPATGEPHPIPRPYSWDPTIPRTPHMGDEYQ